MNKNLDFDPKKFMISPAEHTIVKVHSRRNLLHAVADPEQIFNLY